MHEEQKEMKQLDTGWRVVLLIWGGDISLFRYISCRLHYYGKGPAN